MYTFEVHRPSNQEGYAEYLGDILAQDVEEARKKAIERWGEPIVIYPPRW